MKKKKVFERVMEGLNEALAHARGKDTGAVVHRFKKNVLKKV